MGRIIVGQLVATSERLVFYEKKPTRSKTLETVGVAFEIPADKVIAAKFEKRFRSSSSRPRWDNLRVYSQIVNGSHAVNMPPTLLDGKEVYNALVLAVEGKTRPESLTFEVTDPIGWLRVLSEIGGQRDIKESDSD